jgi:large subunit ribosomal protein L23
MGFLDRFKSKKEQELKDQASSSVVVKDTVSAEKKTAAKPAAAAKPAPAKKGGLKRATTLSEAMTGVILHPLVTEKSAIQASLGQYAFVVPTAVSRVQVRAAVKAMYGVTPVSVNIQRVRGKWVRFGRFTGQRQSWKKAIVTLPKGKAIDVYEGA